MNHALSKDFLVQKPLRLGVAGLGTVGVGVLRMLQANSQLVTHRAGRSIEVVAVSARDREKDRGISLADIQWYDNPLDLTKDPTVDIVVELIGGSAGTAYELVSKALEAEKGVVTANKALIAIHGVELAKLAKEKGIPLLFEAAVAGGIPAIKLIREALAADRLKRVGGILNGTCNYILTAMTETGRSFEDVLKETQQLGYAEADPSMDIDGIDAAHKLAILTSLGFGRSIKFEDVFVEGIRNIDSLDIFFAKELGYTIRLVGMACQHPDESIALSVYPALLPVQSSLARVNGVTNAVITEGEFSGRLMLEGAGAGEGPTSTAVTADIVDIARGNIIPTWGTDFAELIPAVYVSQTEAHCAYYVRLMVEDKPGVVADIAAILRDNRVSLRSLLQHGVKSAQEDNAVSGNMVPIILVTHKTREFSLLKALEAIRTLPAVLKQPVMIRIDQV